MIKKVLIANRGEIAVRVIRTCREMGILSVAVYSDADRRALHVRYADEVYHIGPSPSRESYLNGDKIIEVALKAGADAIHPGYGFLSENADFARKCAEAGIIFIGPDPDAIDQMGDKITARQTMIAAGVPVVPGTQQKVSDMETVRRIVNEIGLPVIIKASAGGGGKGMRLVRRHEDLISAVKMAQSEALSAFGDDTVYIEKYVESPHHIEFQILADRQGNVVHLFERECSIQRRHQKVIEETPSPFITPELREQMGQAAVAAAKAVNYVGAGTIEFLVDANYNFYFLEMNTRLQVEHPITERVIGIDLVKEQIQIASGLPISFKQHEIAQHGHAIECRILAEDPFNNFMPSPGLIRHISEPNGLGVRTDGYAYEGYEIPIYYDPMISKLITWGRNRTEAIDRMKRALFEYKITGVKTSIRFLERIMDNHDFRMGNYNTHFIPEHTDELMDIQPHGNKIFEDMAIIAAYFDFITKMEKMAMSDFTLTHSDNWKIYGIKRSLLPY
ncbi:MAG TPA: acetyl-CoA carboxylase biotin carboxylase subunit [Bacteroidales bacterium]|nr:acetyl-CoA carboxylase biotin carboxylase subunit [Bacteroidales bacterium]